MKNNIPKYSRIILNITKFKILHPPQIESAKALAEVKHGNNKEMTKMFSTLVENNTILKHDNF